MRALSLRLRLGAGGVIGGRVVLALAPGALSRLAEGRRVVLVSGTNGKTTTAHLIAAALRTAGRVAHNDTGANMPDGLVAALAADRRPRSRCWRSTSSTSGRSPMRCSRRCSCS